MFNILFFLIPAIHCRPSHSPADLASAEGGERGVAGRPAGDEPGAQGDARRQRDQLHRQEPRELQLRAGQEEAEQDRGAIHHRRANVHRVKPRDGEK